MKKNVFLLVLGLLLAVSLCVNLLEWNRYEKESVIWQEAYEDLSETYEGTKEQLGLMTSQYDQVLLEEEVNQINYDAIKEENGDLKLQIKSLSDEVDLLNETLESTDHSLEGAETRMFFMNLEDNWQGLWDQVYTQGGVLTDTQLETANQMLQPFYEYKNQLYFSPLCGFFTMSYEQVTDIDLSKFLYHFYQETKLTEEDKEDFNLLKTAENFPFNGSEDIEFDMLPVPIHRYDKKLVDAILMTYAGTSSENLKGKWTESLVYLDGLDAYYNFTSDFGPGVFHCDGGEVKEGMIYLYQGTDIGKRRVLTLVEVDGAYHIKSLGIE